MILDWARRYFAPTPAQPPPPVTGHVEPPEDLVVDAEGFLVGDRVEIVPSVRHSALTTSSPIGIVHHFTATDHGTAKSLARRIRTYRRGVDRAASWHVIVAHDGALWQSVPFLRGAWHCAKGTIEGFRVNACAVGIELEGHGKEFPPAQIEGARRLLVALHAYKSIRFKDAGRGHSEFDPARRSDPGPVWMAILPGLLSEIWTPEAR